ncbi:MAG: septum formation protein Maf [Deltaproteobacteria bacterium]|nr:septum formation protein Maf [Deltaproteobacteria bacterium]
MVKKRRSFNKLSLPTLLLASQSPRRRDLLSSAGLRYQQMMPTIRECTAEGHPPAQVVEYNARVKAEDALKRKKSKNVIAIGADTLVVIDGQVLGKPKTKRDVVASLKTLSGRTHDVLTGLALVSPHFGSRIVTVKSRVTFRKISLKEMVLYAQTQEPYDKAGAYAVQGLSSIFIKKIDGLYTNVMGLPMEVLFDELEKLTGIPPFYWASSA